MKEGLSRENLTNHTKIGLYPETKPGRHLIEGVSPIIACIGSFEDFKRGENLSENTPKLSNNFLLDNLKKIDQGQGTYGHKKGEDCITGGPGTFVISAIDDSNKFSQGFYGCTGLIVTGIDEKTGKNISFMTHQPPFVPSVLFGNGLKKRFTEIQERCQSGTIDAVIVGGMYRNDHLGENYIKMIRLLSTKTQQFFGFEPIIINGPKTKSSQFKKEHRYHDDVYYDNNNRRAYLVRPRVNFSTKDFISGRVDEEKGKWVNND